MNIRKIGDIKKMTPLWGATTSDESQPKFLTTLEKQDCYADSRGWIYKDPKTGLEEVLVAIGGLSASLGAASIMQVYIPSRENFGSPFSLNLVFNEAVTVTGSPVIDLGGVFVGTGNCVFAAGNNTHELQFTYTPVAGDNVVNITIPDTITLDTGMNLVTVANLTQQAETNLESAGYNSTTNVKPSLANTYIIKTVPVILSSEVLTRATDDANVSINVNFSNAVTVVTAVGTPYVLLGSTTGASHAFAGDGKANYAGGNASTSITFTYPTISGDNVAAGWLTLNNHSIVLNSGFINAVAVLTTAATINLETAGWSHTNNVIADLDLNTIAVIKA